MTTDEVFANIVQQNDVIISLLARLAWTPDKIAELVMFKKKDPDAYVSTYNALDGIKTVTQLAAIAGVKQPTMSVILQSWLDEGIVLNTGTEAQPKYRRLMRLPEKRKVKAKQDRPEAVAAEAAPVAQGTEGNNAN
jgi:hypothetical protein